jgi:hypothetical protein
MNFVFVIVTPKHVWATYNQTICFKGANTEKGLLGARASAFTYGKHFNRVYLDEVHFASDKTDSEIFAYLEQVAKDTASKY